MKWQLQNLADCEHLELSPRSVCLSLAHDSCSKMKIPQRDCPYQYSECLASVFDHPFLWFVSTKQPPAYVKQKHLHVEQISHSGGRSLRLGSGVEPAGGRAADRVRNNLRLLWRHPRPGVGNCPSTECSPSVSTAMKDHPAKVLKLYNSLYKAYWSKPSSSPQRERNFQMNKKLRDTGKFNILLKNFQMFYKYLETLSLDVPWKWCKLKVVLICFISVLPGLGLLKVQIPSFTKNKNLQLMLT